MQYLDQFMIIAIAHILALMSPGPDFAVILKQSITYGKKSALYTSLGISTGILIHVTYSILGVGVLISQSAFLHNVVKYLGAIYLIYLGFKALSSNSFNLKKYKKDEKKSMKPLKAFITGFLTNALNPKATLFFISLFTVIIHINTPIYIYNLYALFFFISTFLWFGFLSYILTRKKVRDFFNSFGKYFDRIIAIVLISLGIKVALSG